MKTRHNTPRTKLPILSTFLVHRSKFRVWWAFCLLQSAFAIAAWAQPTNFTYQGVLQVNGAPANGIYDFQFVIYNVPDIGSPGASALQNSEAMDVGVTNGLFAAGIPFQSWIFSGEQRWLEVQVRTNDSGEFTGLTPWTEITPTPYAVFAISASVGDDTVTSAKIVDGTITSADLGPDSVNTTHIINGQVMNADVADNAVTSAKVQNGSLLGLDLADNTVDSLRLADSISLGDAGNSGQLDVFRTSAGTPGISLIGSSSQISTYGSDGLEQIRLYGGGWGELWLHNSLANNATAALLSANGGSGAYLTLNNSNGTARAYLSGDNDGGYLDLRQGDGAYGIRLYGDSSGAGLINVNNNAGSIRVSIDGESTGTAGRISVYDTSGTETVQIIGAEDTLTGGQILMRNTSGINTIQLDSDASGVGCGYIRLYKSDGTATITMQADSGGSGRIITQVLRITGGSDLSEQFDINTLEEELQPGAVVCIDPENPGELRLSLQPYDRTVAGVISGAGGINPGMLMGQTDTMADGKHPVALSGRVYVNADTSNGTIQPGDLLTTSATQGTAMKVTDHARAQGAILGKAMTGLSSGRGIVLVLVTLQ